MTKLTRLYLHSSTNTQILSNGSKTASNYSRLKIFPRNRALNYLKRNMHIFVPAKVEVNMQASKYTNENKTMYLCLEEKGYRNNKSKEKAVGLVRTV